MTCSIPEKDYRRLDQHMPDFCERMAGERVLIVGDSLSSYSHTSWVEKILSGLGLTCPALPVRENLNMVPNTLYGCNNLTMYYIWNIFLSLTEEEIVLANGRSVVNEEWFDEIEKRNITVLVLNRGSHYKQDADFVPEVNKTLGAVYKRYPHVKTIWRSTPHGRHDQKWSNFRAPTERVNGEFPVLYPEDDSFWGYGHFARQNRLVYDLIRHHYPGMLYLDVFNPTTTRADSRYDPIHPCIPGLLDTWLEMLYNILVFL